VVCDGRLRRQPDQEHLGVDAAQQHLQVIASARSVRLVTRSGRRCGELGRVRLRPGSIAEIAS